MVEDKNSSHKDTPYTMPDVADIYAQAGAAFKGAEWLHDAAYKQDDDIIHAAEKHHEALHHHKAQHKEKLITENDLSGYAAEIRAKCAAQAVPASDIEKIIAQLFANVGAPISQLADAFNSTLAAASEAIENANGDHMQVAMSADEQMHQLYANLKQIDVKIQKSLDELHAEGLISDDDYKRLKKERDALDALPENDPHRIAGEQAYNKYLEKVYEHAGQNAQTPEQQAQVHAGKDEVNKRNNVIDELNTLQQSRADKHASQIGADDNKNKEFADAIKKTDVDATKVTADAGKEEVQPAQSELHAAASQLNNPAARMQVASADAINGPGTVAAAKGTVDQTLPPL